MKLYEYDKQKGCGIKLKASIYDNKKFHICGSHNMYNGEGQYLLRHRFMILCENCKILQTIK